jgi:hypothetical protein
MENNRIAYFISSHGFGHAARSSAIMAETNRQNPQVVFDIYTQTPEWFFLESEAPFEKKYTVVSDIGIIQISPMEMDTSETVKKVTHFLSSIESESACMAELLRTREYQLVISDISPLGIKSAQKAGIPCILFENFTWDWIYEIYETDYPEFIKINRILADIYRSVDVHGRLIPFCDETWDADLIIPPVSRNPKHGRSETRKQLGIDSEQLMGLISMGGIPENFQQVRKDFMNRQDTVLVIEGNFPAVTRSGSLIFLPHHSEFYNPDLVSAADFFIGKAGYSTVAELFHENIPFGYMLRSDFRETGPFRSFLQQQSNTLEIEWQTFKDFRLSDAINQLIAMKNPEIRRENGAKLAADLILQKLRTA